MITSQAFRHLALSFPDVTELPHFDKASFRINKKIFATLDEEKQQAAVKLSMSEQSVFSAFDKEIIYPVPNKWGAQGWTIINLKKIRKAMLKDALETACHEVARKK